MNLRTRFILRSSSFMTICCAFALSFLISLALSTSRFFSSYLARRAALSSGENFAILCALSSLVSASTLSMLVFILSSLIFMSFTGSRRGRPPLASGKALFTSRSDFPMLFLACLGCESAGMTIFTADISTTVLRGIVMILWSGFFFSPSSVCPATNGLDSSLAFHLRPSSTPPSLTGSHLTTTSMVYGSMSDLRARRALSPPPSIPGFFLCVTTAAQPQEVPSACVTLMSLPGCRNGTMF
mmetsp:Transcript_4376/g.9090  ORF Transcript_4376/g.9090 Transcript_4376/m.9090 type:complete len:241 (-) Transcript_4376:372-1094(-)